MRCIAALVALGLLLGQVIVGGMVRSPYVITIVFILSKATRLWDTSECYSWIHYSCSFLAKMAIYPYQDRRDWLRLKRADRSQAKGMEASSVINVPTGVWYATSTGYRW